MCRELYGAHCHDHDRHVFVRSILLAGNGPGSLLIFGRGVSNPGKLQKDLIVFHVVDVDIMTGS